MRHGFVAPFVTEREFVELARAAEAAGWDAIFTWESVYRHDAWATLGAAAVATSTIRLGTLITPVSRYRPWDLAARVGTVDRLSQGRVVLGAGLGAPNGNWTAFEPDDGRRLRRERTDEVLTIYAGLMSGQPYTYHGTHFSCTPVREIDPLPPYTRPHPPVWVVGALVPQRRRQPSLARAARWEGVFPAVAAGQGGQSGLTVDTLAQLVDVLRGLRRDLGLPWDEYQVCVEGDSYGGFGQVHGPVEPWESAGGTWWIESWWDLPDSPAGVETLTRRVERGPNR